MKITELPEGTGIDDDDWLVMVQKGVTKKIKGIKKKLAVKLINNLTTNIAGEGALDAAMGKLLADEITKLSSETLKRIESVQKEVLNLSGNLQNKMDRYYGTATLSDVSETTVLKHLILDADLIHQSHEISFSVLANSTQFYSGIMYSDGGATAWGQIQQRNADNAPGSLYSFYYNGTDPMLKKIG